MTKTEQERRQKLEQLEMLIEDRARYGSAVEDLTSKIAQLKYELQFDPKPENSNADTK